MATPTTYSGSTVAIFLETSTAGQYTRPCGLDSHTLKFSKNTNDVTVPDCDDPDLPAWIEREVDSLDFSADGSGLLAAAAVDTWWEAFSSASPINARVYIGKPDNVANGHYWEGEVIVTSFEISGERKDKAKVSVSVVSNGEMTYNDVTV